MKLNTLGLVILCTASTHVAAEKEYWFGSDGQYVRDSNGHCVRTGRWTPEAAIPGCEGGDSKASAEEKAPVAVEDQGVAGTSAEDTSAAGGAETVAVVPAVTEAAEPKYTTLSLASGATFELGGSELSAEGKAAVTDIVTQFKGREVDSVIIEGHTDDRGDEAFNQDLSEKRAEAVKAEAVANGANPDKITTVGYGEMKPIADNGTREGRAKNRRVEIKVDAKEQQI